MLKLTSLCGLNSSVDLDTELDLGNKYRLDIQMKYNNKQKKD